MQLHYIDGPFKGTREELRLPREELGSRERRIILDPVVNLVSELDRAVPVRVVVYEISFINEARTYAELKCVDDGLPKCKNPDTCQKTGRAFREARSYFLALLSPLEVVVTKYCVACHLAAVFEVRARN